MKYIAVFDDEFLSNFRLDDNGETLVLTDKRGYTRVVKLLPYEKRPQGEWIDHEKHIECNHCRVWFLKDYLIRKSFCPNCGADMRTKEAENEQTN